MYFDERSQDQLNEQDHQMRMDESDHINKSDYDQNPRAQRANAQNVDLYEQYDITKTQEQRLQGDMEFGGQEQMLNEDSQ